MRIGFLFNHDQPHQVAHSLPVAIALARHHREHEIVLACAHPALRAEIERLLDRCAAALPVVELPVVELPVVELGLTRPSSRLAAMALDGLLPVRKLALYRDQLPFFRGLDALVVTEKTSSLLRTRYGLDRLTLIHTRHGAGDRANGFDAASRRFDHVLAAGPRIRDRLIAEAGLPPDRVSVVGYPKFDLPAPPALLRDRLFADPTRPVVLYNPHPAPALSSWYRHGQAVLAHFLADRRFNLIFAPHVMLFARTLVATLDPPRIARPGRIPPAIRDAPNIHVDPGSPACTDMSYTGIADLYLGDASSQVYEFLRTPRPCLFLDAHRTDWRGRPAFRHWQAGAVLDTPRQLGAALDRAFATHESYRPVQQRMFADSFDLQPVPAAIRAAEAVHRAVLRGPRDVLS